MGSRHAQQPSLFAEKCSALACRLAPISLCRPFLLLCGSGWKEEKQETVLGRQLCWSSPRSGMGLCGEGDPAGLQS